MEDLESASVRAYDQYDKKTVAQGWHVDLFGEDSTQLIKAISRLAKIESVKDVSGVEQHKKGMDDGHALKAAKENTKYRPSSFSGEDVL